VGVRSSPRFARLVFTHHVAFLETLACLVIYNGSRIIESVIRSFANGATQDIFDGIDSRRARTSCPRDLWPTARRKLDQLNRVRRLHELRIPPGNRLEQLRGDRKGQYSIRINDQFRICFRWEDGHADKVEIADYH
jgi:proteic killer suppression protein